jgi:aminopeptidase N
MRYDSISVGEKAMARLTGYLVAAAILFLPAGGNAFSLPSYHITASFDLPRQRLHGIAEVVIPRTLQALAVGRNLKILSFSLNAQAHLPEVKDGLISLPPHPDGSVVRLEYEGVFTGENSASSMNIVSKEGTFLTSGWYPAAGSELCRFSLQVRVPEGFQAVSEADSVSVVEGQRESLVTFDFPHPVAGIHLAMAPFVVTKVRYRNVEIATYFLPEDRGLAERYLEQTRKYLQMYEEMLGPYPFRRFAVVENILPTGYSMPTFTLLGRQVLKLPFIPETSLGHEILHSWFGNSVYVDYDTGNWCEGLTTYVADHHYAALQGKDWEYRKNIIEEYESYIHGDNEIPVRDFRTQEDRAHRAVGYGKTAMIFHMLRNRVGKEAFADALRLLVQERAFQVTSWQDLERIFSTTAGRDLSAFFRFWLVGKGAMELEVDLLRLRQVGPEHQVEFRLKVKNSLLPLQIPVVLLAEGRQEKRLLTATATEQAFSISLGAMPQEIIVDPDYDLFRNLAPAERRPLWSRLLGDPTRTAVLPDTDQGTYKALIDELGNRGFKFIQEGQVTHTNLPQAAFLFLGPQSGRISLFPATQEEFPGFSLEIRENVFNSNHVVGQVTANNAAEVSAVAAKLFHYGQYSRLRFSHGRNTEKEVQQGDRGMHMGIPAPVMGIPLKAVLPLSEIVSQVADKTIVYVGEKHDRYGDHLMQLEVIQSLRQGHGKLAIGMEMFQRRYQKALDQYVAGTIDEQTLLQESHYFTTWGFNYHLYRDILEYARAQNIPIIALNLDTNIVSKVARDGLAHLNGEEKALIPKDMDFSDQEYKERLRQVFNMHQTDLPGAVALHEFEYFVQAQTLWDETMAESITAFLESHSGFHMVVLAGNGHLAYGSGIPKRSHRRNGKEYAIVLPNPEGPLEPSLADFVVFPPEVKAPEAPKLMVMLESSNNRLVVVGFPHGSGAREAGMEKGDMVVAVDGRRVRNLDELHALLHTRRVGETVRVTVERGESEVELQVQLGTLPKQAP